MNRGSPSETHDAQSATCPASMRPRFMNRGSDVHRHGQVPHRDRFNEAPIHESGKSRC